MGVVASCTQCLCAALPSGSVHKPRCAHLHVLVHVHVHVQARILQCVHAPMNTACKQALHATASHDTPRRMQAAAYNIRTHPTALELHAVQAETSGTDVLQLLLGNAAGAPVEISSQEQLQQLLTCLSLGQAALSKALVARLTSKLLMTSLASQGRASIAKAASVAGSDLLQSSCGEAAADPSDAPSAAAAVAAHAPAEPASCAAADSTAAGTTVAAMAGDGVIPMAISAVHDTSSEQDLQHAAIASALVEEGAQGLWELSALSAGLVTPSPGAMTSSRSPVPPAAAACASSPLPTVEPAVVVRHSAAAAPGSGAVNGVPLALTDSALAALVGALQWESAACGCGIDGGEGTGGSVGGEARGAEAGSSCQAGAAESAAAGAAAIHVPAACAVWQLAARACTRRMLVDAGAAEALMRLAAAAQERLRYWPGAMQQQEGGHGLDVPVHPHAADPRLNEGGVQQVKGVGGQQGCGGEAGAAAVLAAALGALALLVVDAEGRRRLLAMPGAVSTLISIAVRVACQPAASGCCNGVIEGAADVSGGMAEGAKQQGTTDGSGGGAAAAGTTGPTAAAPAATGPTAAAAAAAPRPSGVAGLPAGLSAPGAAAPAAAVAAAATSIEQTAARKQQQQQLDGGAGSEHGTSSRCPIDKLQLATFKSVLQQQAANQVSC